jgi:hypothetical protein
MASNEIISLDAKLYYSATALDGSSNDAAAVTWVEITNVKDVSYSFSHETADGTTRGNGGLRKNIPTLKDLEVTFVLDADVSKAWWSAIRTAFANRSPIALAVMDGDETSAGADGPAANFIISDFSRDEPLAGDVVYNVTAQVHEYYEWYTSA